MAWSTPATWVAGAVLTAAQLNQQVRDNLSFLAELGELGYVTKTTAQTGISGTTPVDLTGLSVAVTVAADRRIRITGAVAQFSRTAGTVTFVQLIIRESGTTLRAQAVACPNTYTGVHVERVVVAPSAGAHTYKLSAACDAGGTITQEGDANLSCFLLVEDIGAA